MNWLNTKVVAFDCDGVLFDSSRSNRAYYNCVLENFGLPAMTDDQFTYVHMHTVDEALVYLFSEAGKVPEAMHYCRQMSYVPFIREMVIEPDLREVLSRLRPKYKTAIATNRTNTMARVLKEHHLQGWFDKVITAADVLHAKPHPEQLHVLMAHFGIRPEHMIYVGDSELDESAAHQAGVAFVAYNNIHLKADQHIGHLGQLLEMLPI